MKKDIHPTWYPDAKITCACGQEYHVGSTVAEIRVEICSHCHPLFTGQEKLIDTEKRVERFERRRQEALKVSSDRARVEKEKKERIKRVEERPRTLKEILQGVKNNQP